MPSQGRVVAFGDETVEDFCAGEFFISETEAGTPEDLFLSGVRDVITKQLHSAQESLANYHKQTVRIIEDACAEYTHQKGLQAGFAQNAGTGESPYMKGPKSGPNQKSIVTNVEPAGQPQLAFTHTESQQSNQQKVKSALRCSDVENHKKINRLVSMNMGGSAVESEPKPALRDTAAMAEQREHFVAHAHSGEQQFTELDNSPRSLGSDMDKRNSQASYRQSVDAVCTLARASSSLARSKSSGNLDVPDHHRAAVFIDAASMKEKVKMAIMKPEYSVMDNYYDSGILQRIARSSWFDSMSLVVITINALWIAVDTDLNTQPTLIGAHPAFVIAENFFCAFFFGEIMVRLGAFKQKRRCITDPWFVFDSCMSVMMVLETWCMTFVLWVTAAGSGATALGDASILRLMRLLRMTRMARMVRLLRALPELMILVKGIVVATRSVFFTLCLLVIIIYVFAVCLTQITEKAEPLHSEYFSTTLSSMNTLLLRGTLPDLADIVNEMGKQNYIFAVVMLIFILLSSLTVMNMLVGVLVEVVSVVSSVEKEEMTLSYVKSMLMSMLEEYGADEDADLMISKREFEELLLKPRAARIIQEIGVDVVGLVDYLDFIFHDGHELSFPEFMDVVLQLRGTNNATVRDVIDLRKFVLQEINNAVTTLGLTFQQSTAKDIRKVFREHCSNSQVSLQQHGVHIPPQPPSAGTGQGIFRRSAHEHIDVDWQKSANAIKRQSGWNGPKPEGTTVTPNTSNQGWRADGHHGPNNVMQTSADFYANTVPDVRPGPNNVMQSSAGFGANNVMKSSNGFICTNAVLQSSNGFGRPPQSSSPLRNEHQASTGGVAQRPARGRSTSPRNGGGPAQPLPAFPDHFYAADIHSSSLDEEEL